MFAPPGLRASLGILHLVEDLVREEKKAKLQDSSSGYTQTSNLATRDNDTRSKFNHRKLKPRCSRC